MLAEIAQTKYMYTPPPYTIWGHLKVNIHKQNIGARLAFYSYDVSLYSVIMLRNASMPTLQKVKPVFTLSLWVR